MNCRMPRTRVSRFELLSRQQASSSARLPTPTPASSSLRERRKKRGVAWVPRRLCAAGDACGAGSACARAHFAMSSSAVLTRVCEY